MTLTGSTHPSSGKFNKTSLSEMVPSKPRTKTSKTSTKRNLEKAAIMIRPLAEELCSNSSARLYVSFWCTSITYRPVTVSV